MLEELCRHKNIGSRLAHVHSPVHCCIMSVVKNSYSNLTSLRTDSRSSINFTLFLSPSAELLARYSVGLVTGHSTQQVCRQSKGVGGRSRSGSRSSSRGNQGLKLRRRWPGWFVDNSIQRVLQGTVIKC